MPRLGHTQRKEKKMRTKELHFVIELKQKAWLSIHTSTHTHTQRERQRSRLKPSGSGVEIKFHASVSTVFALAFSRSAHSHTHTHTHSSTYAKRFIFTYLCIDSSCAFHYINYGLRLKPKKDTATTNQQPSVSGTRKMLCHQIESCTKDIFTWKFKILIFR